MGSCCWKKGGYEMEHHFKMVNTFRIFIETGMVNDYWIVCILGIVNVLRM